MCVYTVTVVNVCVCVCMCVLIFTASKLDMSILCVYICDCC